MTLVKLAKEKGWPPPRPTNRFKLSLQLPGNWHQGLYCLSGGKKKLETTRSVLWQRVKSEGESSKKVDREILGPCRICEINLTMGEQHWVCCFKTVLQAQKGSEQLEIHRTSCIFQTVIKHDPKVSCSSVWRFTSRAVEPHAMCVIHQSRSFLSLAFQHLPVTDCSTCFMSLL